MVDYGKALQKVAEVTGDNKRKLNRKSKQRQTSIVDLYGTELSRILTPTKAGVFRVSVSPQS